MANAVPGPDGPENRPILAGAEGAGKNERHRPLEGDENPAVGSSAVARTDWLMIHRERRRGATRRWQPVVKVPDGLRQSVAVTAKWGRTPFSWGLQATRKWGLTPFR